MSIEKDIKQYNKFTELTKLVNEIKYSKESIAKYIFDYKEKKLKERIINAEMVDYFTEVERKRLLFEKEHQDIDLQDLLLALNKKHKKSVNCYLAYNSIFILFDSDKKTIEVEIKLKKPLSNQKEEVYNELIELLK